MIESLVTVLNSSGAGGDRAVDLPEKPSERSAAETCDPLSLRAVSSPTARANWGWWVTSAPAVHSATASS